MAMFAIYFILYVIIWLEKLLFVLISLHEHFKVNICLSFTSLVSSGLICDVKWTNLFCLFLIVKCRKLYRHDETKKISCKGVEVHQWQSNSNCQVFCLKEVKFSRQEIMNTIGCPFIVLSGIYCGWVGASSEALVHSNRRHGAEVKEKSGNCFYSK